MADVINLCAGKVFLPGARPVPTSMGLWQGFREGARLRSIASGIGSEHFDQVVAEGGAVNDTWATGTKYHVLEAAVHIDVVANVFLVVEVVGGLPPRQRHLKVAK